MRASDIWDSIRGTDRIATYFRQLYNIVYVSNDMLLCIWLILDYIYRERKIKKERQRQRKEGERERMVNVRSKQQLMNFL